MGSSKNLYVDVSARLWNFNYRFTYFSGGGALNFISGRGVQSGFPKCEACERIICLWKTELVNWKFPNGGGCELKISKFGGLRAKI